MTALPEASGQGGFSIQKRQKLHAIWPGRRKCRPVAHFIVDIEVQAGWAPLQNGLVPVVADIEGGAILGIRQEIAFFAIVAVTATDRIGFAAHNKSGNQCYAQHERHAPFENILFHVCWFYCE